MHDLTPIDDLADALGLGERELVSIVGGGGKTTTLFALSRQLDARTILTTTTKMGSDRTEGLELLVAPSDREIGHALDEHRRVLVWSERSGHRAEGVSPARCDEWFSSGLADYVVVEADGSRRRPFKAPYPYEPVVPETTSMLLACIGASALGQPIAECCHRPDTVAELTGRSVEDLLTPAAATTVLLDERGSRKGQPDAARFAVLVHRVTPTNAALVDELVQVIGDRAEVRLIGQVS